MADSDITGLTELTSPAVDDWLAIDDTSDSGTTKKISIATLSSNVYNVLTSYGADNTGTTDTAVACQAALDAARLAGGGLVYFPAGTYSIGRLSDNGQTIVGDVKGGLKVGSNTRIVGDGPATIIQVRAESYGTWIKMCPFIVHDDVNGEDNISFADLTIDGNRDNVSGRAGSMEGIDYITATTVRRSGFKHNRLIIKNVVNEAIDLNSYYDDWYAVECHFIDCGGDACHANIDSINGVFDKNYVDNCGNTRAVGTGTGYAGINNGSLYGKTTNNVVRNCIRGIATGPTSYHTIANNSVDNFAFNSTLTCDSFSFPDANTVRVTTSSTIHSGENLASIGDSITFSGVTITAGNDINGSGRIVADIVSRFTYDVTFTHGGGNYSGGTANDTTIASSFNTDEGIFVSGTQNIIANNTLFQAPSYIQTGVPIRYDTGVAFQIVNNSMLSDYRGIHIEATGNGVISSNEIAGTINQQGIFVEAGEHVINGNQFIGSRPSNAARGAIQISAAAVGCSVSGNYFAGAQAGRAILSAANNTTITGNVVAFGSSSGYELEVTGDACLITANRVAAASTDAVLLTGTNNFVHGNSFVGSTATSTQSVDVSGATTPTVSDNKV